MVANDETHIAGLLRDHVFVQKCIFQQVGVTSIVCSTSLSDHESVGVRSEFNHCECSTRHSHPDLIKQTLKHFNKC